MICHARRDDDPAKTVCSVDLGDNKRGCACRIALEAEIEAGKFGIETRVARVPDSARPIELEESA